MREELETCIENLKSEDSDQTTEPLPNPSLGSIAVRARQDQLLVLPLNPSRLRGSWGRFSSCSGSLTPLVRESGGVSCGVSTVRRRVNNSDDSAVRPKPYLESIPEISPRRFFRCIGLPVEEACQLPSRTVRLPKPPALRLPRLRGRHLDASSGTRMRATRADLGK